jgi:hypothetical protein
MVGGSVKGREIIESAANKGGAHLGDMLWTNIAVVDGSHIERAKLAEWLDEAGLPEEWAPEEVTGQYAFGRALSACRNVEKAPGVSIEREALRSRVALVRVHDGEGLTKATQTWARIHVDDLDDIQIEWAERPEVGNARAGGVTGSEEYGRVQVAIAALKAEYLRFLDFLSAPEFGSYLRGVLDDHLKAMPVKQNGGLWFVPTEHCDNLQRLAGVVEKVGGSRLSAVPFYDSPRGRASLGQDVRDGLLREVAKIVASAQKLGQGERGPRESSVTERILKLEALNLRAASCRTVLASYAQDIAVAVAEAKESVEAVLAPLEEDPFGDDESEAAE